MEKKTCSFYSLENFCSRYSYNCLTEHHRHFYFSCHCLLHKLYGSLLYDQNYCKKKITKKNTLILDCRESSWSHNFSRFIPLVEESRSLLVIIYLLTIFFILDGIFNRSCITLWFFFNLCTMELEPSLEVF